MHKRATQGQRSGRGRAHARTCARMHADIDAHAVACVNSPTPRHTVHLTSLYHTASNLTVLHRITQHCIELHCTALTHARPHTHIHARTHTNTHTCICRRVCTLTTYSCTHGAMHTYTRECMHERALQKADGTGNYCLNPDGYGWCGVGMD